MSIRAVFFDMGGTIETYWYNHELRLGATPGIHKLLLKADAEDNDIQFFDEVKETLHMLKSQGFLLGIVTDTRFPVSVKLSWLERGGFGNVWDTIISSNELGIHKPDPKIYQAAMKQLGLSADQAVFVGHVASELAGAKSAGMITIAFNFERTATADYYINEFAELLKVLVIASEKMEPTRQDV